MILCVLSKFMKFATKKAFTMMELVVVMFLLSIGFFSIITMLNSWSRFTQIIRTKIVALNLAREGVEAMFQMRDTNRRRRSSKRDLCWLKTNPLVDDISDPDNEWCENWDERLWSGNYVVFSTGIWEQKYFVAQLITWFSLDISGSWWIQSWDLNYSLCFWSGEWYPCPWREYTWWEWKYFRQITGKGLFLKNSNIAGWEYLDCKNGSDVLWPNACGDSSAKEYRFCSKVEYNNGRGISNVEICSLMTNFFE